MSSEIILSDDSKNLIILNLFLDLPRINLKMSHLVKTSQVEEKLKEIRRLAQELMWNVDYCLNENDESKEGSVGQYLDDYLKKVDENVYYITEVINKLRKMVDDEADQDGNPLNAWLRWYSSGY